MTAVSTLDFLVWTMRGRGVGGYQEAEVKPSHIEESGRQKDGAGVGEAKRWGRCSHRKQ